MLDTVSPFPSPNGLRQAFQSRFSGQLNSSQINWVKGLFSEHGIHDVLQLRPDDLDRVPDDCYFEFNDKDVDAGRRPEDYLGTITRRLADRAPNTFGVLWMNNTKGSFPGASSDFYIYSKGRLVVLPDELSDAAFRDIIASADMIVSANATLPGMPGNCRLHTIKVMRPSTVFMLVARPSDVDALSD